MKQFNIKKSVAIMGVILGIGAMTSPAMAVSHDEGDLTIASTANTTYLAGTGTTVNVTENGNEATVRYGVNVDGHTVIVNNGVISANTNVLATTDSVNRLGQAGDQTAAAIANNAALINQALANANTALTLSNSTKTTVTNNTTIIENNATAITTNATNIAKNTSELDKLKQKAATAGVDYSATKAQAAANSQKIAQAKGDVARLDGEIAKRTTKEQVAQIFVEKDLATHTYVNTQTDKLKKEISAADTLILQRLDNNESKDKAQNIKLDGLNDKVTALSSSLADHKDVASGGTASAVSLAMLPAPADGTNQISVMWGNASGKSALGVGVAGTGEKISYKGGISLNTAKKTAFGAGVGYSF